MSYKNRQGSTPSHVNSICTTKMNTPEAYLQATPKVTQKVVAAPKELKKNGI